MTNTTRISIVSAMTFAVLAIIFSIPHVSEAKVGLHGKTATSTRSVDATCMQTAVETRETALMSAFETFTTDIKSALTERKSDLVEAWGMSDVTARNTALKSAWKEWKTQSRAAHASLKSERKSAWESFKTTVRTSCKTTLPKDEMLSKDSAGALSL